MHRRFYPGMSQCLADGFEVGVVFKGISGKSMPEVIEADSACDADETEEDQK